MQHNQTVLLQPIKSDGTLAAEGSDAVFVTARGVFTLEAATTYYVEIPTRDMNPVHAHLQGDAAIVITSATLEESDMPPYEAPAYSDNAGEWLAVDATRITSAAEGTGWSAAADIGAAVGGNAGGVVWNISDGAPRRTRCKIVVGATGGQVRFAA